jgi:hypothetical protein
MWLELKASLMVYVMICDFMRKLQKVIFKYKLPHQTRLTTGSSNSGDVLRTCRLGTVILLTQTTKKLRGFSPPVNYIDRPTDLRLSAKLVPNFTYSHVIIQL